MKTIHLVSLNENEDLLEVKHTYKTMKDLQTILVKSTIQPSVRLPQECWIGYNVAIGSNVIIRNKVVIQDNVKIKYSVFIGSKSIIGSFVTIDPNTKVGYRPDIGTKSKISANAS